MGNKHNNQRLPSFHLLPLNMKYRFPLRRQDNITMYCHVAHLERQDCNLCAGPDFYDYAFSDLGVDKFWYSYLKLEDCKDMLSQLILKCKDGSISIHFFLFGSDFRDQKRFKHFKVSNFSFSKNSLGTGAFTLSSVWPFTIHQEALQLWLFCSANPQTVNLWTWLNSTGAQHRKLVSTAPPSLMEWQP